MTTFASHRIAAAVAPLVNASGVHNTELPGVRQENADLRNQGVTVIRQRLPRSYVSNKRDRLVGVNRVRDVLRHLAESRTVGRIRESVAADQN